MSAVLAGASAVFNYQGASITLSCSSPEELRNALATFGIGAANDAQATTGNVQSAKGATAPAGKPASQAAEPSAAPAAEPAAQGEAGNGAAASQPSATAAASSASSSAESTSPDGEAVTFDELKKAFLALSAKADGRAKCEAVLASVDPKPGRLSEAKPEQYAALLDAIKKASK
jgi:hypothetical protein